MMNTGPKASPLRKRTSRQWPSEGGSLIGSRSGVQVLEAGYVVAIWGVDRT